MSISTLSILNNGRPQDTILPSPVQQSLQAAAFYYIIYLGRISVPLRKPQKGGDVLARTRNRKTAYFI